MKKISNKMFVSATTLFYAAFVIFISLRHVVWRNEVVPMTVAAVSTSLPDLCAKIHSFGHPLLWYLLLYIAYHLIHGYWVLKAVNILVCVGAIYLFAANSPFSRAQKILFILGFFPLYLYPVFNCNYGISMLLLFSFASLYPKRFGNTIPLGFILLLLANTHAHSLITAAAILLSLASEFLFNSKSRQAWRKHSAQTLIGFGIALGGMVFSAIQTMPGHNNIIFNPHPIGHSQIAHALIKSIVLPGKAFIDVLGVPSWIFTTLVIFGVYVYLLSKPYVLIFFGFAVVALSGFYHLIFPSDDLRHQGALYLLLITVFWIESYAPDLRVGKPFGKFRDSAARHKEPFFIFLLVLQICMALPAVKNELTSTYSSSKSFGEMLNQDPRFKDAILISEPGAKVESIPYYADNTIYLPRERKFKKFTQFTTDQKLQYSMDELLAAAENIKSQTGKPILIVTYLKLSATGPFLIKLTHGRSFIYTKESLDAFNAVTQRVAVFNKASSDENYSVYLLK